MCEKIEAKPRPRKAQVPLDWYEVALACNKYQRRGFYVFSIQL